MKNCIKCRVSKEETEFNSRVRKGILKVEGICKICVLNEKKAYYARNKEKFAVYGKKKYSEHKKDPNWIEKRSEYKKQYDVENRDHNLAYKKLYNAENSAELYEKSKARNDADPLKFEKQSWKSMKQRCLNPKSEVYKYYGAKGITVCDKWIKWEGFNEDMGPRPEPKAQYSLDRIDSTKGYGKDNCRWATKTEQSSNTSRNRLIEYNGESRTLFQLARDYKINPKTLAHRLDDFGWSIEKALTTPVKKAPNISPEVASQALREMQKGTIT